jgi:hypothetical protein
MNSGFNQDPCWTKMLQTGSRWNKVAAIGIMKDQNGLKKIMMNQDCHNQDRTNQDHEGSRCKQIYNRDSQVRISSKMAPDNEFSSYPN